MCVFVQWTTSYCGEVFIVWGVFSQQVAAVVVSILGVCASVGGTVDYCCVKPLHSCIVYTYLVYRCVWVQ